MTRETFDIPKRLRPSVSVLCLLQKRAPSNRSVYRTSMQRFDVALTN